MRRGHFDVTRELINSEQWPLIEAELYKVFTLECKESKPYGVISFHGTSYLFDETPELTSPKYSANFKTVNNRPVFTTFTRETEPVHYKPNHETR